MRTILFVLLLLMYASLVHSAKKPIVIGMDELDYLPILGNADVNGRNGILVDIMNAFLVHEGYHFTILRIPTTRLRRDFYTGRSNIDLIMPDNKKWGPKPPNLIFSEPIYAYTEGTIVLGTSHVESVSDIKILGTPEGFTAYPYREHILSGKIKIYENKSQYLVEQLSLSRIDAVYMSVDVSKYYSATFGVNITYVELLPHSSDFYYASTFYRKDLIIKLNNFVKTKQEIIKRIEKKYSTHNR